MDQVSFNVIVGLILRAIALMGAGWLADHALLPTGTAEEWAGAVALAACGLLWSWAQKRTAARQQQALIQAALAMPATATVADVHAAVATARKVQP